MIKYILSTIAALMLTVFLGYRPELMGMAAMIPADLSGSQMAIEGLGFIGLGLIINSATLEAARKGFNTLFNQAFSEAKTYWDQVAMLVPSGSGEEVYAWLKALPKMREWLGDRTVKNIAEADLTIKNKDWELTIGVPRNAFLDDNLGVYSPLMSEMGRSAALHPDELIFGTLLPGGFSSLAYDGQFFFDTDHPVAGASVSNFGGGSGTAWYLLDTTRSIKPFIFQQRQAPEFQAKDDPNTSDHVFNNKEYVYGVDSRDNAGYGLWQMAYASKNTLDSTAYAAARAAMMSFKDDEGRPLGIMPSLLVVPPSLESAAREILKADRSANGESNIYKDSADLLVVPWLT
jgi:phage major head subunit gpT-like protein